LRLQHFPFDAVPYPNPDFHFDTAPYPASQNDADPDPQHCLCHESALISTVTQTGNPKSTFNKVKKIHKTCEIDDKRTVTVLLYKVAVQSSAVGSFTY
jgi:hypothetical protein